MTSLDVELVEPSKTRLFVTCYKQSKLGESNLCQASGDKYCDHSILMWLVAPVIQDVLDRDAEVAETPFDSLPFWIKPRLLYGRIEGKAEDTRKMAWAIAARVYRPVPEHRHGHIPLPRVAINFVLVDNSTPPSPLPFPAT